MKKFVGLSFMIITMVVSSGVLASTGGGQIKIKNRTTVQKKGQAGIVIISNKKQKMGSADLVIKNKKK